MMKLLRIDFISSNGSTRALAHMQLSDIAQLETTLGVVLPEAYRKALLSANAESDDLPEFLSVREGLLQLNQHFLMDPEDLSELRGTSLLDRLRFFLVYKSPKKLIEHNVRYKKVWNQRFKIGTDLSEEEYFIKLSETEPKVYRFDLETNRVSEAAPSIDAWIEHARAMAAED